MSLWFKKYILCVPRRKEKAQQPKSKKKNLSREEKKLKIELKFIYFFVFPLPGRVHSAMVSKLNPAQRSVTVEWYERGETKGKEVELDVLLELNPEVIRSKQYVAAPPPTATAPVNLQRVSILA